MNMLIVKKVLRKRVYRKLLQFNACWQFVEKLRVNFKIALFTFHGSTSHKLGCLLVVFLDTCIQWVKLS